MQEDPQQQGRLAFWWKTLRLGTRQLNAAAGWAGTVVLILGLAGIVVPLILHQSHWLIAVILLSLLVLVVAEGGYQVWRGTAQDRAAALTERDAAKAEYDRRFDAQRYALWFAGMGAFNDQATGGVRFHLELANKSSDPLRYEIENLTITIDGRQGPPNLPLQNRGEILPANGSGHYAAPELLNVHQPWQQGTLTITVRYGHPSAPPKFRAKTQLTFRWYNIPELPPGQRNPLVLDITSEPVIEDI